MKDTEKTKLETEERGPADEKKNDAVDEEIGETGMPLCREPWENLYILRRGILPCCYGNPIGYSFNEYAEAWNSPQIQEIRRYLSQGELSPYCLECLGCPIVQRYLAEHPDKGPQHKPRPLILRLFNRLFFRIPSKIWQALKKS